MNNTAEHVATSTSSTTVVTPVPSNQLMDLNHWGPLLGIIMAVAAIVAMLNTNIKSKIADFKATHDPVHAAIVEDIAEIKHESKNTRAMVKVLETSRAKDEARFVKLEESVTNFREGQGRIEKALDKLDTKLDEVRQQRDHGKVS